MRLHDPAANGGTTDNGAVSTLSSTMAALAHGGGRLLRLPTAFLLVWACVVLGVLGLELWALLADPRGPGPVATVILLVLLALLALPVVVLAIRRARWLRLSEAAASAPGTTVVDGVPATTDVVTIDALGDRIEDEMIGVEGEHDVRAVMNAFTEIQLPTTERRGAGARMTAMFGVGRLAVIGRVFGRMERAQRALMTAAGGRANAPYLVDDLRVTVAAFVGTLVTIGIGSLGVLVLAAVLLTR